VGKRARGWLTIAIIFHLRLVSFRDLETLLCNTATTGPLQATVRTEPPGAMVAFDDHIKTEPSQFDDLDPRKYRVRIMSPGYDPIETTIDLSDPRASASPLFRMTRSKGGLEIDASEGGLPFAIRSEDGEISRDGVTPAKLVDLPTGKYEVTARRGDWELRDTIEINRGETARKMFAFLMRHSTSRVNQTARKFPRWRASRKDAVTDRSAGAIARIDRPLRRVAQESQTIDVKLNQENSAQFCFRKRQHQDY